MICDSSLSFFPLSTSEVSEFFAQGKREIKETMPLSTSKELLNRSQQEFMKASYSRKKGVPQNLVSELAVDPQILEQEHLDDQAQMEAEIKEEELNVQDSLRKYFSNHPEVEPKCIFLNLL